MMSWRRWLRRSQYEEELERELSFHLEKHASDLVAQGHSPEEARRRARLALGGPEQVKETCRDGRGVRPLEDLWQDLRYGARVLRKSPGFTIVAVLTLALGIGANATIFSLANALLLRPLPVAEPGRVMSLYAVMPDGSRSGRFSWPDYVDFREQNDVFSGLTAQMQTIFTLGGGEQSELIFGEVATGNYFSLLGVGPALGRTLAEEDDRDGAPRVAVIGYDAWQRRFGGDPSVIGRDIRLNGELFTIIGVVRRGYTGTRIVPAVEAWIPLSQSGAGLGPDWRANRARPLLQIVGRLKPGVGSEQAQAAMTALAQRLAGYYRDTDRPTAVTLERTSLAEGSRRTMISAFLAILLALTGMVLLVACANVANLMLVRAVGRQHEMAVRRALGASRWRLMRQLATEGFMLALLGGFAGVMLSIYAASLLQNFNPLPSFPLKFDLGVDWRVIAFSLTVSLLTGVLLSLAPAILSTKPDLVPALKEDSRGGTSGPRRAWLRNTLAIAQTALSLVLLVSAGLMLQTLKKMEATSPGFDPNNVIAMDFDLSLKGLAEEQGRRHLRTILSRVAALSGVESASLSSRAPLDISTPTLGAHIEGHHPPAGRDSIPLSYYRITPGFFRTMAIPVVAGRDFDDRDDEKSPGVAIINETMARRYWPGQEPVGKHFRLARPARPGPDDTSFREEVEIVGVAKDSKYRTLGEEQTPFVYLPFWQNYSDGTAMLVRSKLPPGQLLREIRGELVRVDGEPQGFFPRTMHEHMAVVIVPVRIAATLFAISGAVAMLLASVGLYGVVSYSGRQRTQEMGIRIALGAQPRDILVLMLGQGLRLSLIGVVVGLAASLALARFLSNLLFGVGPNDPVTFAAATVLLTAVTLVACYLPARRATKVDPLIALRAE
jgi:putative ABC transport system permease protein